VEPAGFTRVSALGIDEQRVNVIIDLLEAAPTLGDGFRVEARVIVWEARDVLQVPASALFQRESNEWSVFVVEAGRAHLRAVQVGHRTSGVVEVIGGLVTNDEVVLFPSDQVRDGVRVRRRRG
jgi:HlyD family secretion protein